MLMNLNKFFQSTEVLGYQLKREKCLPLSLSIVKDTKPTECSHMQEIGNHLEGLLQKSNES